MELLEKLEEIKQVGNYAVSIYYGEGIGADDSDIRPMERRVRLITNPVGHLGSRRNMWEGKMKDFLRFDFKKEKPVEISNPPKPEEYEGGGYFTWGAR